MIETITDKVMTDVIYLIATKLLWVDESTPLTDAYSDRNGSQMVLKSYSTILEKKNIDTVYVKNKKGNKDVFVMRGISWLNYN